MIRIIVFILFVAVLFVDVQAHAAVYCRGKITNVYVTVDGGVYIYGDYMTNYTQICSITGQWNQVDPAVCVSWLALAKTAKSQQNPVIVYYPNETSCTSIPIYHSSPPPYYLMLDQ